MSHPDLTSQPTYPLEFSRPCPRCHRPTSSAVPPTALAGAHPLAESPFDKRMFFCPLPRFVALHSLIFLDRLAVCPRSNSWHHRHCLLPSVCSREPGVWSSTQWKKKCRSGFGLVSRRPPLGSSLPIVNLQQTVPWLEEPHSRPA
jgi:hypothetical protein